VERHACPSSARIAEAIRNIGIRSDTDRASLWGTITRLPPFDRGELARMPTGWHHRWVIFSVGYRAPGAQPYLGARTLCLAPAT
jgi:hypothetical protein